MNGSRIVVFTDRDGDEISVVPRAKDGNVAPDPIISIVSGVGTKGIRSQSVVFVEQEVPHMVVKLVASLNLRESEIRQIISGLGDIIGAAVVVSERGD